MLLDKVIKIFSQTSSTSQELTFFQRDISEWLPLYFYMAKEMKADSRGKYHIILLKICISVTIFSIRTYDGSREVHTYL